MPQHADWLRRADVAILQYLSDERPDYVPLVANRLGLNLAYAERRFDELAARGLVEPVSDEVVYRITDRGERHLAAARSDESIPTPEIPAAGDD